MCFLCLLWLSLICADHCTDAALLFLGNLRGCFLRVAPVVEDADLVNALQRAGRRAPLLGLVLAIEVFHRVLVQRDSRVTALLRTPVHQTLFTDVEIAGARAAAPV